MVAVLSETTAGPFLPALRTKMRSTPSGRALLRDRPRITEASVNLDKLAAMKEGSLGRAYVDWLRRNKVTPDTRDPVRVLPLSHPFSPLPRRLHHFPNLSPLPEPSLTELPRQVRYIDDPELAYIMQRYRESHDFYHVLLGFGVSLPAELVVKWFELANFHLPVALLSGVFGPLRMEPSERRRLMKTYGAWALKCGGSAECLIGVYWEKEWERDLEEVRKELGVFRPPVPFKEWRAEGRRIKAEKVAAAEGSP